jgi:signal transduction histidine kinase
VHTIDIIFSSFNIFYIQEKLGVIQSLKNKAKHGVNIRILTPKSGYVGKTVQALKKEIVDGSFDAHYFSWNSDIRTKTLIVDREQSLAMEILQVEEGEGIGERETEREYCYNSGMLYMEPEESKKYLAPILRSAKRLGRLTGDILDLTRIDSRSLRLNKEQLSLDEVILHAIQDIRSNQIGHYKKGRVSVIYDSRAGKEGEFVIEADKVRLTQVISHILGNAIRFTNEGTITINIDRKAITSSSNSSSDQKGVIISIKDTGTGIDSQIFSRLFSKFATKSENGTGLGLFISKSIVEAHGGKIWAENNADGIGATFAFSLPLGS